MLASTLRGEASAGSRVARVENADSGRPGVYENQAAALEVANIAGRESGLTNIDDTCYLDIADLTGATGTASLRGDPASGLCRDLIERQNSAFKVLFERLGEGFLQLPSAPGTGVRGPA